MPERVATDISEVLQTDAATAARRLLGAVLEREIDGQLARVMIVETEAYDQTDEASHTFKGKTKRNATMFGPCGRLYVYFTYGMHYCCTIVAGEKDFGAGVLIRAVEPLEGQAVLAARRGGKQGVATTNGPGKLCQALGITLAMNGHDLHEAPLRLMLQPPLADSQIVTTTRVGISAGKDTLWRFYIADNPYVSVKRRA